MKALLLHKPAPIETSPLQEEEIPTPRPKEKEVLIKVEYCGVCHTDLHLVEGEIIPPSYPVIPGHQVVGKIEKTGEKVTRWKTGERVGIPWFYSSCGRCKFCRKGKENLCNKAQFTGFHVNGGYAEYAVADQDSVYLLPEKYPGENVAPLLCGGVIGYRALKLTPLLRGETLGIFGFGASGHIVLQIAKYFNLRVFVFTRSEKHQEVARELGADWVGKPDSSPPELLDGAIIFAPAGELVPIALGNIEKGGTLTLAGIYMTPIPSLEYPLLYQERIIRSVANSTREDVRELLDIAGKTPLKTVVEVFPWQEANQVLQKLKTSQLKASAVLKF